jgi:queuine tRNA-ribosyltransferase
MQNISFFMWLTDTARMEIQKGTFMAWKEEFLRRFNSNPER